MRVGGLGGGTTEARPHSTRGLRCLALTASAGGAGGAAALAGLLGGLSSLTGGLRGGSRQAGWQRLFLR